MVFYIFQYIKGYKIYMQHQYIKDKLLIST